MDAEDTDPSHASSSLITIHHPDQQPPATQQLQPAFQQHMEQVRAQVFSEEEMRRMAEI